LAEAFGQSAVINIFMEMPLTQCLYFTVVMIKKILALSIFICCISFAQAQKKSVAKWGDVQKLLSSTNDTTYVINFWATWCTPCVKEYPAFQALAAKHKDEKVRVVMLSLDFLKEYDKTFAPYMAKHPINGSAYLFDEPDYNSWINKIDKDWQGEIPVTVIVNGSKHVRAFLPHDFTTESLEQTFTQTIKQ
jgi:thiol-disulfide isomerase/thioredoxin